VRNFPWRLFSFINLFSLVTTLTAMQAAYPASGCLTVQKQQAVTECVFLFNLANLFGRRFVSVWLDTCQLHNWLQRWRNILLVRSVGAGLELLQLFFYSCVFPDDPIILIYLAGRQKMCACLRRSSHRASEPHNVFLHAPKVLAHPPFLLVQVIER
jgi:hypothetical protein